MGVRQEREQVGGIGQTNLIHASFELLKGEESRMVSVNELEDAPKTVEQSDHERL